MEEERKNEIVTETAEEESQSVIARTHDAVVRTMDRTGDGKVSMEDFKALADGAKEAAHKAGFAAKGFALKRAGDLAEKMSKAKLEAERRALSPIFIEDVEAPEFFMSKLIRVTEVDQRHAESPLCEGSIGFETNYKGLRIVNLYWDKLDQFGLRFYPDRDQEVYYVDPSDRDFYIALDDYFNYLKIARINELQKIAHALGAKHFKVVYKEQKKSFSKSSGTAKTGAKRFHAEATHEHGESALAHVEIAAEMEFEGHAPVRPELHYLQRDASVKSLIDMRMGDNSIKHQKLSLNMSNSSGIKVKDAVKIDAALSAMKIVGNATVTSEAQSEERRTLEYEIDF